MIVRMYHSYSWARKTKRGQFKGTHPRIDRERWQFPTDRVLPKMIAPKKQKIVRVIESPARRV